MGGERERARPRPLLRLSRTAAAAASSALHRPAASNLSGARPVDALARCLHLPMSFRSEAPPNFLRGSAAAAAAARTTERQAGRQAGGAVPAGRAPRSLPLRLRASEGNKRRQRRSAPPSAASSNEESDRNRGWPSYLAGVAALSLCVDAAVVLEILTTFSFVRSRQLQMEKEKGRERREEHNAGSPVRPSVGAKRLAGWLLCPLGRAE